MVIPVRQMFPYMKEVSSKSVEGLKNYTCKSTIGPLGKVTLKIQNQIQSALIK